MNEGKKANNKTKDDLEKNKQENVNKMVLDLETHVY